jgi:hypothetical protein
MSSVLRIVFDAGVIGRRFTGCEAAAFGRAPAEARTLRRSPRPAASAVLIAFLMWVATVTLRYPSSRPSTIIHGASAVLVRWMVRSAASRKRS